MLQLTRHPTQDDPETVARQSALSLDRTTHARAAHLTGGLSPVALALAYSDWLLNLMSSPGTHYRLAGAAHHKLFEAAVKAIDGDTVEAPPHAGADGARAMADQRFSGEAWQRWPYKPVATLYQAWAQWCTDAARLPGMTPHHADMVSFFTGQLLDMAAPTNSPASPDVLKALKDTGGDSIVQGARHFIDDWRQRHGLGTSHTPSDEQALPMHQPGRGVAITPGKVVYRNHLVELIQYTPTTGEVFAEPVFIVPSWIMKYYILDLSPHNSMVRYLVSQGHTVFILSWRNPDESDALLGMEDYLHMGVFDPLAYIQRALPSTAVPAMGYCLGGTLLAIAAAALARPGGIVDAAMLPELKTVSLLAAQVDFEEPGEIGVLIDPTQVRWLEDIMAEQGFLSGRQMASSFQFLHAKELVWSRVVREYMMGQRDHANDLMAWNADVTRMPATMHSQYLNSLFIRNDLAQDKYLVEGRAVSLSDLRMPVFAVATEKDHVSPWRSVHKLHRLTNTDLSFVLTSGGHNAGILSEPGHANRHYRMLTTHALDARITPDDWLRLAPAHEGSWWPRWQHWLVEHSTGLVSAQARAPASGEALGSPLPDAPGEYVLVRYPD